MNPVIFANLDYSCVCVTLEYFKVIISGVRPQCQSARSGESARAGVPRTGVYVTPSESINPSELIEYTVSSLYIQ